AGRAVALRPVAGSPALRPISGGHGTLRGRRRGIRSRPARDGADDRAAGDGSQLIEDALLDLFFRIFSPAERKHQQGQTQESRQSQESGLHRRSLYAVSGCFRQPVRRSVVPIGLVQPVLPAMAEEASDAPVTLSEADCITQYLAI